MKNHLNVIAILVCSQNIVVFMKAVYKEAPKRPTNLSGTGQHTLTGSNQMVASLSLKVPEWEKGMRREQLDVLPGEL